MYSSQNSTLSIIIVVVDNAQSSTYVRLSAFKTMTFILNQIHLAAQSDQPDVVKLFLQKQPSLVTTTTKVFKLPCDDCYGEDDAEAAFPCHRGTALR